MLKSNAFSALVFTVKFTLGTYYLKITKLTSVLRMSVAEIAALDKADFQRICIRTLGNSSSVNPAYAYCSTIGTK
jgi:hypothetical protein